MTHTAYPPEIQIAESAGFYYGGEIIDREKYGSGPVPVEFGPVPIRSGTG